MSSNLGTYEFIGSGYRGYIDEKAPISQEAFDITDRLMGDIADPQVYSLTKDTIAKIVEAGRGMNEKYTITVDAVKDKIFDGAPGIKSEKVTVSGDGEVSFVGELEVEAPIYMSFDLEDVLPHMIALYDATKDKNVDLKPFVGAVDEEELEELVEMLESENIDNPDLKGYLVWMDRKTGKLYEGANSRVSPITHVATLDDDPTVYPVENGKVQRTKSQEVNFGM